MKKYNLKLFQKGHNSRLKIFNKKSENILSIGASVELKNNKVCISYNEIEINKCGFDKIKKIEIYKESKLICCEERNLGFCTEFPNFLSDGIYEIRTTIINLIDGFRTCVINTFEFFKHNRGIACNNFKLNFNKVDRNLCISFNKKIGKVDLSEVRLSNINLFDSKGNQIKNIACKIYSRINNIDFIILDIFDNENSNKLIPNEIYTLKIKFKNNELVSSFSFEYDNIKIKTYRIIDDVNYEILSNTSEDVISVRVYFRFNKFINVDDYDCFISNIRSKFLYYQVSQDEKGDTIVFECIFKNEKNYFELNICKGESVNIVRFDYDFTNDKESITQKNYFNMPYINKNLNKYTVSFIPKDLNINLNTNALLLSSDKNEQIGINFNNKSLSERGNIVLDGDDSYKIVFENVSILNKFNEIYSVELDCLIKESFIFSPSIGVKFNQLNYKLKFSKGKKLNIKFLGDNYNLRGSYSYEDNKENKLNILDNFCILKAEDFDDFRIIYLKIYGDNNKVYFGTIILDYIEVGPFIRISHSEKFLLDQLNYLSIVDKNIFDNFKRNFEVCILSENKEVMQKVNVRDFNEKFKIYFDNIQINKTGMYYIKFKKRNNYKICSFFVKRITDPKNLFIKNIDESGMELIVSSFNQSLMTKSLLKVKIFLLIDNVKYLIIEQNVYISCENFKISFPKNLLLYNTEYLIYFEFDKDKIKVIPFTYVGNNFYLNDIEEGINELNEMLLCDSLDDRSFYGNSLIIDKVNEILLRDNFNDGDINIKDEKFNNSDLDDVNIVIKKAYDIFLNYEIKTDDREFILWKRLIWDGKINLKYFIEVIIIEYILKSKFPTNYFKNYGELVVKILDFINIEHNLNYDVVENINKIFNEEFIDEILDKFYNTSEYKGVEYILNNYCKKF